MDGQENQLKCLCVELLNAIIDLCEAVKKKGEIYVSDRLLRASTEIGVRVFQACGGLGAAALGDRLDSALSYVNETVFLLTVLLCRKLITKEEFCCIDTMCAEIRCILRAMLSGVRVVR